MGAFAAALAFAPGLAIGSFLNVVAVRLPVGRSIVHPPSACLGCEQEIAWYDNIPLVSWLLLRGRCRNCASTISVRYPLLELVTALLVAGCVWKFGVSGDAAVAAFTCIVLVAISAVDIDHRIIPNKIVLPSAAIVLAANTLLHPSPSWAIAALGAAGFLFAAALAYPKGMGMGDVKLALLMGAAVGRAVPVAMMLGMMTAVVPGIVLLLRHGSAARKMGIPFGPFLALGTVVALFAGPEILHWYWSIGR